MTTTPPPPEPTDDEIRVRIATHCGWSIEGDKWPDIHLHKPNGMIVRPSDPRIDVVDLLPNYLTDLNACAEFEKTLTEEQWQVFIQHLCQLVFVRSVNGWWDMSAREVARMLAATARQRALSFLATINGETQ